MRRLTLLALAVVLVLAACGNSDSDSNAEPSTTTAMAGMDPMDSMDGMEMNMGNPEATAADEVTGADLATGDFVVLETRPQGYDDVGGTADLARHDGGTTVTIRLENLPPGVDFISHVHVGGCAELGGDHFQFDEGGSDMPPNEIHLAFRSADDGTGFMTAENDRTVDERAVSVVVHPRELLDNKVACAEFGS